MTKHKDGSQPDETAPEDSITPEELTALKEQLTEARAKADEYMEALQRERADFTNFRRRTEIEAKESYRTITGTTIKKFLTVMDDLERALSHRPADDSWSDGIELVHRKFQAILDAEGITRIDAEGKPFDPNLHEAIMQEPSPDHEPGTVIAVLQQGYMHGERILRPAMVKVAQ